MTGYVPSSNSSSPLRGQNLNILLLIIIGFLSLLLAEQVLTGWLSLGERINISRRDLNLTEWLMIVGSTLWGLFAFWSAVRIRREPPGLANFFEGEGQTSTSARFITVLFGVIGGGMLLTAVQIFTGWIALGDRVNISRRDLNWIEWAAILLSLFWAGFFLRTALGFLRRERPAWSWGQWGLFAVILLSMVLFLSGLADIASIIPRNGTILDNPAGALELLVPALLVFVSCLTGYRMIVADYGQPAAQKSIAGTLAERARARDIRRAKVPADQAIRNQLAQTPGAGAIIGFIALFMFFSIASDLFLSPASLASALTNNITRGIVAIGATMLMISGEFDLSVGSLLGIAGLTFLGLMTGQFPPGGPVLDPITAAILTVIFVGFLGSLNGFILIRTGIPSFIVTLATQLMLRGLPLVFIAGGRNLRYVDYYNTPPNVQISRIVLVLALIGAGLAFAYLGRSLVLTRLRYFRETLQRYREDERDFRTLFLLIAGALLLFVVLSILIVLVVILGSAVDQVNMLSQNSSFLEISFFDIANGRIESLPFIGEIPRDINLRIGVFWWLVLVLIFQFVLNETRYGNATFATGGNAGAARAQGINVNLVKVTNYILVAMLAAVAGILDASRLQSIDALRGQFLELDVIAATVIGGALLTGGYGSIIGALLGVFIFGMMQTGLVLIGVDPRLFDAFKGAIILIAVIINNWSRRIKT